MGDTDPLPIEELALTKSVVDKKFLKFEVLSYYGSGGGLEYLDILRTGAPRLKSEVRRDCMPGSGQCPALPQWCPASGCVSQTVRWATNTGPAQQQQGCSFRKDGLRFSSQPKCLSRRNTFLPHTVEDGVVQLNTSATFLQCQPWSDTEPCHNIKRILTKKATDSNTFSLDYKPCNGEKGVEIELVDISDSDGLNKTGWKLFYMPLPNYPLELRESSKCFRTKKNLCGPGSLSFFTEEKEENLVLTNCDGAVSMREEYDNCG